MKPQDRPLAPKDKLAAARLVLIERAPYFITVLMSLVPREAPGLGTLGVSKNGILAWDPDAVAGWTVDEVASVLVHEVQHVLLDHFGRCVKRAARPDRWNEASDLAINSGMTSWSLPAGALQPERYGFPKGQTAEQYYDLLERQEQEQKEKRPSQQDPPDPQAGQPGRPDGSPSDPSGTESSTMGSGRPTPPPGHGDPEGRPDPASSDASRAPERPACAQGWCGSGAGRPHPGEQDDDPAGRGAGELERVRRQTAEAIKGHIASRGIGSVPGDLARWADQQLKPSQVRWQDRLARLARSAIAFRPGAIDYHYNRPSRRQAGVGYGNGRPVLPALHQPVPTVAIAIDTSGSMGRAELETAIAETKGVLDAVGVRVQLIIVDAAVHGIKQIDRWERAATALHGGGGTDMRPALTAATKLRPRPSVLIIMTDGFVPDPGPPPAGIQVVWLVIGGVGKKPCAWGHEVLVGTGG